MLPRLCFINAFTSLTTLHPTPPYSLASTHTIESFVVTSISRRLKLQIQSKTNTKNKPIVAIATSWLVYDELVRWVGLVLDRVRLSHKQNSTVNLQSQSNLKKKPKTSRPSIEQQLHFLQHSQQHKVAWLRFGVRLFFSTICGYSTFDSRSMNRCYLYYSMSV